MTERTRPHCSARWLACTWRLQRVGALSGANAILVGWGRAAVGSGAGAATDAGFRMKCSSAPLKQVPSPTVTSTLVDDGHIHGNRGIQLDFDSDGPGGTRRIGRAEAIGATAGQVVPVERDEDVAVRLTVGGVRREPGDQCASRHWEGSAEGTGTGEAARIAGLLVEIAAAQAEVLDGLLRPGRRSCRRDGRRDGGTAGGCGEGDAADGEDGGCGRCGQRGVGT